MSVTRDYKNVSEAKAKATKAKSRSPKGAKSLKTTAKQEKPSGRISLGFVLFAGVIIGAFVSFLVYLSIGMGDDTEKTSNTDIKETVITQPKKELLNNVEPPEEKSRFEFYSILPERKIEVPVEEISPEPAPVKSVIAPRTPQNNVSTSPKVIERAEAKKSSRLYVLQAGSFTRFKDADKRKATLAFMGVSSKIHAISKPNQTMYRVQVGPFSDIKKINNIAALLKKNKIPSLLMKVKG